MASAATSHFLAIWRIVVSPPALSHWVTSEGSSVVSRRSFVPLGARKLGRYPCWISRSPSIQYFVKISCSGSCRMRLRRR